MDVRTAVRIGLAALAGSSGGAFFAAGMSTEVLKPVIMVVLLAVAAFVIARPTFGTAPAPGPVTRRRILAAIGLAGLGIGFYDGLIGPGTGNASEHYHAGLLERLATDERPMILDADALNRIAKAGKLDLLKANHVITPHPGEFARLAPDLAERERLAAG